jgi:hypothetical protein
MTERRVLSDYEKDGKESEAQISTLRQVFKDFPPPSDWRTRSDYERDDVASDAMSRMFEDREKRRREGKLPPPPGRDGAR